jgi:hypothetical protein
MEDYEDYEEHADPDDHADREDHAGDEGVGWGLLSGEARHKATPDTFQIPPLATRNSLQRGDLAKLLFDIATHEEEGPAWCVERMWVRVLRVNKRGYVGTLANVPVSGDPAALTHGSLVEFEPHHVIDVRPNAWHIARELFALIRPDLDGRPRARN